MTAQVPKYVNPIPQNVHTVSTTGNVGENCENCDTSRGKWAMLWENYVYNYFGYGLFAR